MILRLLIAALLACLASNATAGITPSFTARPIQGTTCVAPCAVHFDAIGKGALSTVPYVTEATTDSVFNHEFHTLLYEWDFDDPNSGTWSAGAAAAAGTPPSKNYDMGPIAGHVYENPGTYTVTLTVTNPAGERATTTREVTVEDASTYISEANTYCFANTAGTFQGCPLDDDNDGTCEAGESSASDNCTVTADLDTALEGGDGCTGGTEDCADYDVGMRRILFRRGDTFTASTTLDPYHGTTPGIVGAFSSGAKPVFNLAGNIAESGDGWTFVDLTYTGCNLSCFTGVNGDDRTTYLRVEAPAYGNACWEYNASLGGSFVQWARLWAFIDSSCTGSPTQAGYGSWPGMKYLLFMGNTISHDPNEHGDDTTLRARHLNHALFAHSTFTDPSPGREHLQLRTFDTVSGIDYSDGGAGKVLVQDIRTEETGTNSFYTVRVCVDAGCNCGLNPSTCGDNTEGTIVPVTDYIFERNFFAHETGTQGVTKKAGVFELQGGRMTVRNNVVDLSDSFDTAGLSFVRVLGEPVSKVYGDTPDDYYSIHHNTIYFSHAWSTDFPIVDENVANGTGCTADCYAFNNLLVAPNFTASVTTTGFTGTGTTDIQTPNPFVGAVPARNVAEIDDFALAAASAPIDAGYDFIVGTDGDRWVHADALGNCRRDGQWDIGAFEYGATACASSVVLPVHRVGGMNFGGVRW